MYKAAGAIGTISIGNPKTTDIPWERSTPARLQPSMSLADPSLDETSGQQLAVTMNPAHADKLLVETGHTFSELLALVDAGKPVPAFPLKVGLTAKTKIAVPPKCAWARRSSVAKCSGGQRLVSQRAPALTAIHGRVFFTQFGLAPDVAIDGSMSLDGYSVLFDLHAVPAFVR